MCIRDRARQILGKTAYRWITLVAGLLISFMGVRVGWLWWEQVVRIKENLTTYEENSSWRFPYFHQHHNNDTVTLKNDFDMGPGQNCASFWNCGDCTGVGTKGEEQVDYHMYKLIDQVKRLRGAVSYTHLTLPTIYSV
eukprot:TRINITY_DN2073_c0_g1_i1.p1 TRINITY_DN2073_c0_g1~~TRINITY_DN2073_c0_g1_i1.p1  ORF type:complete len:138 (+),score=44.78 TRINITY_DN2073_c0_g1_i1:125-538(+)